MIWDGRHGSGGESAVPLTLAEYLRRQLRRLGSVRPRSLRRKPEGEEVSKVTDFQSVAEVTDCQSVAMCICPFLLSSRKTCSYLIHATDTTASVAPSGNKPPLGGPLSGKGPKWPGLKAMSKTQDTKPLKQSFHLWQESPQSPPAHEDADSRSDLSAASHTI
ncbi:hypothetical protein JZ751_024271 [Albula glossodonta]|uniref:Uncharacterized protein n=1 Tax=Albula glossodonta TaxID=121402 RepID=A0A8T2MQT0_9TELE|nr:hypothetical protein JZ751_024271 [Albula glossodonta]